MGLHLLYGIKSGMGQVTAKEHMPLMETPNALSDTPRSPMAARAVPQNRRASRSVKMELAEDGMGC